MAESTLDQRIAKLQNQPTFRIKQIKGRKVADWYAVTGAEIAAALVINDHKLGDQVMGVSAEIGFWGRMAALARRVWQMAERDYRVWRSGKYLEYLDPPEKPDGWKKPSEKAMEAMYRVDKDYGKYQEELERAEEAYNAATDIREAFKAKRDMLRATAYRARDDGSVQLRV